MVRSANSNQIVTSKNSMPTGAKTQKRSEGKNGGMRVILALACVVVIVAGLKAAATLFIPVLMGLFLAILSLPILNWIDGKGLPRPLAVLMTVAIDLLIIGGIALIASGVIPDFQKKGGEYADKLRKQAYSFSESMDQNIQKIAGLWNENESGNPGEDEILIPAQPPIPTFKELLNRYWDSNRIVDMIGGVDVVSRFTSLASTSFFVMVIMIFILSESGRYGRKVKDVIRVRGPDLRRFQNSSRDIQKYLAIKTGASALTGILAGLVCKAFDVDFPILWGLVAFLFNYIPAIGSIIAAIPSVILSLIDNGFWPAMGVLLCYLIINVTIGNFLEPMLLGDRFDISTTVVILSVILWGYIWGPVGMFLAVPLTMVIKVMLDNSPDLRWISVLIGGGRDEFHERTIPNPASGDEQPSLSEEILGGEE